MIGGPPARDIQGCERTEAMRKRNEMVMSKGVRRVQSKSSPMGRSSLQKDVYLGERRHRLCMPHQTEHE